MSNPTKSQNFEWLKTFGTTNGIEDISGVGIDAGGGCSFLLNYRTYVPDTLKIGYFQYITTKTANSSASFLIKLDSLGKVLKVHLLGSDWSTDTDICRDDKGNIYIVKPIGFKEIFDSDTFAQSNGYFVFAKFDINLNRIWVKQMGSKVSAPKLYFSQGHILFTCEAGDSNVKMGTKTFNFLLTNNQIYGEFDQSTGAVIWCNSLFNRKTFTEQLLIRGIQSLKDDFYIVGFTSKGYKIGADTFYVGEFIVQVDSVGNYKKRLNLNTGQYPNANLSITTDGEYLYIGGNFKDTMVWNGKKLSPQYPPQSFGTEFFVASVTSSLKPRWFYRPKILDLSNGEPGGITNTVSNEGYIYFAGVLKSKILMDSTILTPSSRIDPMIFKMDYLGNVLWAINGNTEIKGLDLGLDAIAGKYVFASGDFKNTIEFGKHKANSNGLVDAWVTKISDNSIFRGDVYKGPYCAGDTIKIPYTKAGDFDSTNYFIAELSNEEGNFENGGRELGRLKSNKDGTVVGKLTLFQVSTSGNYRIRIRSTNPPVQSFFRIDTLRLLIYSRDKADPGPPETICKGDTLKLSTYGGSKWTWDPRYNMNDSTVRQPLAWPMRDTVYRIIIADSHGCGKPDTAFKKVFVRHYPTSVMSFKDTALCNNYPLKIPVRFEGGDSVYQWKWYFVSSPKLWFFMSKGDSKSSDTLNYTPSVDVNTSEKLAIIVSDGCTSKPDTAYLNISLKKPTAINKKFKDTLVCYGNLLFWKSSAKGGQTRNLLWQWKDITNNTILSKSDSLFIIAKQTIKIQLTLSNGCLNDTSTFTLNVNPPLKASVLLGTHNLNDTTLCFGQSLKLLSIGKGGDGSSYNFKWYLNKTLLSNSDSFSLKSDSLFPKSGGNKTLELVLKDNCTTKADSVIRTIKVIPAPVADFRFGLACTLVPIQFNFTGTKLASPIKTSFAWNFANEDTSSLQNPLKLISSSGKKKVTLTIMSSNGCNDIITKEIEVKPQAKAGFKADDVCETDSAAFVNQSKDATAYNWKFGDGLNSTQTNPKHLYNIGGITKTYNVTLVAVSGCSDSITQALTINANPISDFSYTRSGNKLDLKAKQINNSNYRWKFGNTDSVITSTYTHTQTLANSSQYKVCLKVTNIAGCVSETCKDVTVGITNLNKPTGFKLYPNPNSGNFTIEIDNPGTDLSIAIYDLLGKRIKTVESFPDQTSYLITLNLADGLYNLRLRNGDKVYYQKVTICH